MSISFSVSEVQTIVRTQAIVSCQIDSALWSHAALVDRAWGRFDREYKDYRGRRSNLKELRRYMNLLKDAIRVFNEYEQGTCVPDSTR